MNIDTYFDTLNRQPNVEYKEYDEALNVFSYLNETVTNDFAIGLALATNGIVFKIIFEEAIGWQVIIANAVFAFGDNPRVKIAKA